MMKIQIYNSPEEVGARILFILDICNKRMSKQRLMYYDYFSLHINDLDQKQISLHPDNPNHSSEIAIRRDLISNGLDLMIAKGLVSVKYSKTGIYYCVNQLTHPFLQLFENQYVDDLKRNIASVDNVFYSYTDKQIYKHINNNIGRWIGEFENDAVIGGE
ncbi:ABC-three component system middle component 2 [Lacrimispora brassicae]